MPVFQSAFVASAGPLHLLAGSTGDVQGSGHILELFCSVHKPTSTRIAPYNDNHRISRENGPILGIARTPRRPLCAPWLRQNYGQRPRSAAAVQGDPGEPTPERYQARPGQLPRTDPHDAGDRQSARGEGGREGEGVRHPLPGKLHQRMEIPLLLEETWSRLF